MASHAWSIQASICCIGDTVFWTTLCGGQWPERRYSLSRNLCVLITTVKDQMGLPWYHGRGVNVWLRTSQLQTLMPNHTLHRQRFEPVQPRHGPPWTKQIQLLTFQLHLHSTGLRNKRSLVRRGYRFPEWAWSPHINSHWWQKWNTISFKKDCQLLYREVMQLVSVVVSCCWHLRWFIRRHLPPRFIFTLNIKCPHERSTGGSKIIIT